ncbi:unannotated protein [freshwater metagenome]|uniref:Unannotated protein n=1 Tax=freshwater metagenome TaxID=449393 RepID=A0A6J6GB88_9ZZZZ
MAGAQTRGLLVADAVDHGAHGEAVTGTQVALVGLFAVGAHHAGEASREEQLVHLLVGAVTAALRSVDAVHHPRLQHGRRGHDAAVNAVSREFGIRVDRVAIAHGLDEVSDHGSVHLVGAGCRFADLESDVRLQLGVEGGLGLGGGVDDDGRAGVRHDVLSHPTRLRDRHGRSLSGMGSRGRPRPRSAMMLCWISSVPPPMRMANWLRRC